jgi:ketosteroid isomerase-like protein
MDRMYLSFGLKVCRRQNATVSHARSLVLPLATRLLPALIVGGLALTSIQAVHASDVDDRRAVAALDTKYQKAVKENDAQTMGVILADDFILVVGNGKRFTKADLLNSATDGKTHYEHQEDSEQTVLVSGNTAVVTAKLWASGLEDGAKINYTLWFSDVYVRTPQGWRYFFGQASLPLPRNAKH